MAAYSAQGSAAVRNPARTILFVAPYQNNGPNGPIEFNPELFYWRVGCESAADTMIRWTMQRGIIGDYGPGDVTVAHRQALGTGTRVFPLIYQFTSFNVNTIPQYTTDAVLWRIGLNQRAAYHVKLNKKTGGINLGTAGNARHLISGVGWHAYNDSATPTANVLAYFRE